MAFSHRVREVAPSMTLAMTGRAKEMKQQGIDVLDLSAGEPDLPTPAAVLEAVRPHFEAGRLTYTAAAGRPDLRDAIAATARARYPDLDVSGGHVTVTCGAKHALYLALQVLCDDGDEVICPAPYWVSYPEMARLAGAAFVPIPTRAEDGFRVDPAVVAAAITERSRVLILNSPSNPTGALLTRENIAALAELAVRHGLWILSDEIYDQLYYGDNPPFSPLDLGPEVQACTLLINGVSKTYSMTGWRLGWAVGPTEVIKVMTRVQSHETSNANTLAQLAALAALTGDQTILAERRRIFDERRRLMLRLLADLSAWPCTAPDGAFYLFPKADAFFGRRSGETALNGSMDVSMSLLEHAHVATVPGIAFGDDHHVRFSYATSHEVIEAAVRRIADWQAALT